jgi:hydroxymethylpyrimidine pyrophosphatase-like HAD family hydrolase
MKNPKELYVFDYDGTLTNSPATIEETTLSGLLEVKEKRNSIMGIVSGRQLEFLLSIKRQSEIFDFLIAENGAIIYYNSSQTKRVFGVNWSLKVHPIFQNLDIPIGFGEVVISTKSIFRQRVEDVLATNHLTANIELNRDSLMVLPPDVDKGSALRKVVDFYGGRNSVFTTTFGDGENDIKMFAVANKSVAVMNAVSALKERADIVTKEAGGNGVLTYLRESLI